MNDTSHAAQNLRGRMTYAAIQDPKPEAIVIHCSDPRFQAAFEQFIGHELHLAKGHYIPIVVGGGGGVLGHPEQLPKEFKFLKDRLEHYRRVFPTVRRIVLINHEGCRYYDSLKVKTLGFPRPALWPCPPSTPARTWPWLPGSSSTCSPTWAMRSNSTTPASPMRSAPGLSLRKSVADCSRPVLNAPDGCIGWSHAASPET